MKELMCITSNQYDRDQYRDHAEFYDFYHSLDCNGVELLAMDDTAMDEILTSEDVTGIHLPFVNCWVDFWKENKTRLYEEYGSVESGGDIWIMRFFGGLTKAALTEKLRNAVIYGAKYDPEYLVYHVSECTAYESVVNVYHYTDEEVVDATIDFINSWCDSITEHYQNPPWLLLENLWHSGLNLQDPTLIPRLINGIHYPKTAILLDTGHLCHCNPDIATSDEAVDYIHHILDQIEDLSVIKGIHLHHTLSGKIIKKCRQEQPPVSKDYQYKLEKYYSMIYQIDAHQPFLTPRVKEILDRISPEYLVYEVLSSTKEEYAQLKSLYPKIYYMRYNNGKTDHTTGPDDG